MAFVVSSGELATTGGGVTPAYAPISLRAAPWEYETIWRTQPQVRTVIGFIARNIAQLGIHTFRRVSETDRVRLRDHPLAQLLAEPLPGMTQYRFIERIVSDRALYDNFFGIKLKLNGRLRVLPVPPPLIRPYGGNWIAPEYFETAGGRRFAPDEVIHIHGYSPNDLTYGESAIEALRELILESSEAAKARAKMWKNGARLTGVLVRPADAPDWNEKEKRRFREMWRSFSDGGGAEGGTPILEDGMTYDKVGFNPEQAQYIEARKLNREECAAAYYIPPPLIGILDHATYSNIKEQHAHLYQDTLGPWTVDLQQEFVAQLLPDLPGDNSDVYCEFNVEAKMRGDFESQAAAASTATGGPWMTVNETRARNNLPAVEGGDTLIVPLNVTQGGLANPRDTAPDAGDALPKARGLPRSKSASRPSTLGTFDSERDALERTLVSFTERQANALLAAAGAKADDGPPDLLAMWAAGSEDRLAQLQALLAHHGYQLAQVGAWEVLDEWNPDAADWTPDVMLAWILAAAETHAAQHEEAGREAVATVQEEGGDGWQEALATAAVAWGTAAAARAVTASTELRSFGGHDAATASGLKKKIWHTGGTNPRPSHKAQNGESVSMDDVFSNGLRWPGDSSGKLDELVNCKCSLRYDKEG
ncbi:MULTISPECIES: phage portal protein [Streptomyces]|uniref:Phage portal protein n=1 Tax=Streptomyces europaeiscabiei TaxID=146819 RepID=A0ABU4NSY5_9ACTN|nr:MULTISPECIES: phage portal protein [Streptomyces]MBP5922173.1 phage portal protein [Streptomyces sp. LBUM 1483]MDX3555194.1 phage portal protein [Streptomyces europaeiscabiei]MDX3705208.1 phage portal protein [Streptomyces europaeiscabiei]MDX3864381.1 phage portal protein [Streptomyces europaeiscabiei]MDX3871537.1 phage portal protein [Streptomyces europaeiscabiei]